MPGKSAHVKNPKQYEALKDKGMSKERAAKIANSDGASNHAAARHRTAEAVARSRAVRPLNTKRPAARWQATAKKH